MTEQPDRLVNLSDYEAEASRRLPHDVGDYVNGGAGDEITLRRTREVLDGLLLRTRVLSGVAEVDLRTTVLGTPVAFPVLLCPAGFHHRAHPDGELATARAAAELSTVIVLSSGSSRTLEEVAQHTAGPKWFQQYLYTDPAMSVSMAQRAADAGYRAVCLTLDSGVPSMREREIRNRFVNPMSANYDQAERPDEAAYSGTDAPRGVEHLIAGAATWGDLERFVGSSPLPVVAKGIMTAEDARAAADCGVDAVVVSNHGARQLDTTYTSIEALPEVVAEVGAQVEVYLDGGIRRGTDVVKALALGARAVLVGRPIFWGLAVDGSDGLRDCLGLLRDELALALRACGQDSAARVSPDVVALSSPFPQRWTSARTPAVT